MKEKEKRRKGERGGLGRKRNERKGENMFWERKSER